MAVDWTSADDFLGQPVPERLWHYTSVAGFYGIVQSKRIFATDIRFLNDEREFEYAVELMKHISRDMQEKDSDGFPLRLVFEELISYFLNNSLETARFALLISSFSELEDTLSQWRGYAYGTAGVSMCLDLRWIRPVGKSQMLQTLAPCLYAEAEQRRFIHACVVDYLAKSRQLWTAGLDFRLKPDIPPRLHNFGVADAQSLELHNQHAMAQLFTTMNLMRASALCKHPAFHEEKEWRLITPWFHSMESTRKRKFRHSASTLIPYTEERLAAHPREDLPLTDAILGPGSSREAAIACEQFLNSEGFSFVPRRSKVPFRTA